jgi:hypothetical protein
MSLDGTGQSEVFPQNGDPILSRAHPVLSSTEEGSDRLRAEWLVAQTVDASPKVTDPAAKTAEPTAKPTDAVAKPAEPTTKPADPTDKLADSPASAPDTMPHTVANPYIEGEPTPYEPLGPVHAVSWGRPGETVPSRIDDPQIFLKQLLQTTIQIARQIQQQRHGQTGDCALGVRKGLNEMALGFQINDDTVIGNQQQRWRSAVQLGDYLTKSGLFDVYPLAQMHGRLEDGFIVVRNWTDFRTKTKGQGENKGDIAVVSRDGRQYNDHSEPFDFNDPLYKDGYVLVPKGYVLQTPDNPPQSPPQAVHSPPSGIDHSRVQPHHPQQRPRYGHHR